MERGQSPPQPPTEGARGLPHYYREPSLGQSLLAGVIFNTRGRPREYDYHPGFELGISLRGERERLLPGLTEIVRPGNVWMACAWELHGCRVLSEETESVVLLFHPEVLGEQRLAGIPWLSLFAAPPSLRPRVRERTSASPRA